MQEPFDVNIGITVYSIFPEEDQTYTIFKEGEEYLRIQKDSENQWLKLHHETDTPLFTEDEEVNALGRKILLYEAENPGNEEEPTEE